ncbi:hypothetical protein [Pseudomonas baltica]|uniref:hypothetical protein n=1 Tax=Pseudomonas baltica TaxID=2762576 RepID=UPI002899FE37|nr:hypothetical protein [Pseudomonas baltica]
MSVYEIVFTGQVLPGARLEAVKANLARLFQADEQRIELLFSGRRLVLKNSLDAAAAEKYRSTLERAGALVEVVDLGAQVEEIEMAPAPAPAQAVGRVKVVPRDVYMAAFTEVDAPDYAIAEVGAAMQPPTPDVPPPALDLSQLSLAPTGSDLGQAKAAPAAPAPDTSHLSIIG